MKKLLPRCFLERERELHRYEDRRKAQLDYNTDIKISRLQGEKIGEIRSIQARAHSEPYGNADRTIGILAARRIDEPGQPLGGAGAESAVTG